MSINLIADEKGIWRLDDNKHKTGIHWNEIHSIIGYTIDYSDLPEVEIEFDFHYGEYFRINETWQGFNNVIASINEKKMYIENDWLAKVKEVGEDDDIYIIWKKKKEIA